jgi:anti-sigma factor RsiW
MDLVGATCERARFWASLALDGELSELEQAALDEHLAGCAGCASFVAGLGGFTALLRAAPLESPPTALELPLRRRGVGLRPSLVAAAAAVVLVGAGLGSAVGALTSGGGSGTVVSPAASRAPFIRQQVLALELGPAPPVQTRRRSGGRMIPS